ncbi:hypothetical protein [Nocardia sp. NPDC059239]|uniref:hypothetical protein n=1 Tax=unclassified Nocardia TaxID=2637762 RepID=UPI0036A84412
MSYFYDYLGTDQDLLVESDVPRPDLLEWAYWRQITEQEAEAKRPKPVEVVPDVNPETPQENSSPQADDAPAPESAPVPATKAPAKKAASKAAA